MCSVALTLKAAVSKRRYNSRELAAHKVVTGPPFHPAGKRPKAPCPVCIKEKKDTTERELYSIRGFHKDEYDPQIPPSWFTAPPIRLDGSGKEMEALRVHYLCKNI